MYRLFSSFQLKSVQSGTSNKNLLCNGQMRGITICRLLSLCFVLLMHCPAIFAQGIPIVDVFDGANGELVANATKPELKDNMYFANQAIIRTPSVKDIISFQINEESKLVLKKTREV